MGCLSKILGFFAWTTILYGVVFGLFAKDQDRDASIAVIIGFGGFMVLLSRYFIRSSNSHAQSSEGSSGQTRWVTLGDLMPKASCAKCGGAVYSGYV